MEKITAVNLIDRCKASECIVESFHVDRNKFSISLRRGEQRESFSSRSFIKLEAKVIDWLGK